MTDDRWERDADDAVWVFPEPGPAGTGETPAQLPLTPEGIRMFRENLRRIEAGLPLLNCEPPYPTKDGNPVLPDCSVEQDAEFEEGHSCARCTPARQQQQMD